MLYSYTDDIKTRYYIKDVADKAPVELLYHVYNDPTHVDALTGRGKTVNEDTYLRQLLALAQKYNIFNDDIQWDIDHATYSKAPILKITSLINGMSNSDFKNLYNDNAKLNFFVGLALNSTNVTAKGEYLASGGKSHTSTLPAASIGLNFFANPNTRRLVFRVEAAVSENQYRSLYLYKISPYVNVNYSFNQLSISLVPQVIYNIYNAETFKVYAGIGVALSAYEYSNQIFASQDGKTPVSQISESHPFNFVKSSDLALFKAGVQFSRNLGVYASYATHSLVTNDPFFFLSFNSIQVGFNYFFE